MISKKDLQFIIDGFVNDKALEYYLKNLSKLPDKIPNKGEIHKEYYMQRKYLKNYLIQLVNRAANLLSKL